MSKAAVFLDRDGTLNEDIGYLSDPEGLKLLEGAAEAVKMLNESGVKVIVLTNQSGVGRGYYTHEDVDAVNKRLEGVLGLGGARVDGIYYCHHRPDEDCGCRKPRTGLAEKAALEHGIRMKCSYMVGDKASDISMARNLKIKGVLVMTGNGAEALKDSPSPDFVAADILGAAGWIIKDLKARGGCL